jgi:hypothetical protein
VPVAIPDPQGHPAEDQPFAQTDDVAVDVRDAVALADEVERLTLEGLCSTLR